MSHAPKLTPEEHAEIRANMQNSFDEALKNFDEHGYGMVILSTRLSSEQSNEVCEGCGEVHPDTATSFAGHYVLTSELAGMTVAMIKSTIEEIDDPIKAIMLAEVFSGGAKDAATEKTEAAGDGNPLAALISMFAAKHAEENTQPTPTP